VIQARQEDLPMSDQFWLTKAQLKRIEPFFPPTRGIPRVDDRRVVSGIIHVIRNGLRWRDAPAVYGPHKTLYTRFVRWSRMGIFDRIFANLAAESGPPDRVMIDSTHLKSHRTPASLLKKGDSPRLIGRTKGGLNSKLHAVCDGAGRPVIFLLTEGQMSDHKGAALIYPMLLDAETLIADKGRLPATYCKTLYRQRHKVENMFAKLRDWRGISMRYDRCAYTFFGAICIAATVIFWLGQ
jgi:transposase